MKLLILSLMTLGLLAFQNCSEASFSNATGSPSGKAGAEVLDEGPALDEVAEEDREAVHEYYQCGHDEDSESSDDGSSDSMDDDRPLKVSICHNGHVICISENALYAHLVVHVDRHGDEHIDNYGACGYDDDSESDD